MFDCIDHWNCVDLTGAQAPVAGIGCSAGGDVVVVAAVAYDYDGDGDGDLVHA